MHELHYFHKSKKGICGDDFNNKEQSDLINLSFILSLSELLRFELPFSGKFVGEYAVVTMSNNEKYYIGEGSFIGLRDAILINSVTNV